MRRGGLTLGRRFAALDVEVTGKRSREQYAQPRRFARTFHSERIGPLALEAIQRDWVLL